MEIIKTKLFIIIIVLLFGHYGYTQETNDTLKPFKVKTSWYGRSMPRAIYTGAGRQVDRVTQNIEIGKSFGPIDLGIGYGRISLRPDSTQYIQARVTMDACQYGIFSNEFS